MYTVLQHWALAYTTHVHCTAALSISLHYTKYAVLQHWALAYTTLSTLYCSTTLIYTYPLVYHIPIALYPGAPPLPNAWVRGYTSPQLFEANSRSLWFLLFLCTYLAKIKWRVWLWLQIGSTLETVASQDWVRENCARNRNQLLDIDMLGDHTLSSTHQARDLLHLLTPYCFSASPTESAQLARMESTLAIEHILKVHTPVW